MSGGRDETRANEPVRQEIRQPLAVLHVRLASGNGLDVIGIRQHHLEAPLKDVEDGFPVHAGRFQRDVGTARFREPAVQLQQLGRRRPEPSHLGARSTRLLNTDTRHHRFLVHIDPATARMHDLHNASQRECARGVPPI